MLPLSTSRSSSTAATLQKFFENCSPKAENMPPTQLQQSNKSQTSASTSSSPPIANHPWLSKLIDSIAVRIRKEHLNFMICFVSFLFLAPLSLSLCFVSLFFPVWLLLLLVLLLLNRSRFVFQFTVGRRFHATQIR